MPELPEVETVRRGLEPVLAGAIITKLDCRRPDLRFPLPERFATRIEGHRIVTLGRRAKYLVAELDTGEALVMHLGMSGRFSIQHFEDQTADPASSNGQVAKAAFTHVNATDPTHDHVVFTTQSGNTVTYNDPRRFGYMVLVEESERETHKLFSGLGPEPLGNGFSAHHLAKRAHGRRVDLKAFLLDQRNVAGLGNIYVCEALHRSGLSPLRRAFSLSTKNLSPTKRAERLAASIKTVLTEAIAAGGSTLRDYAHADGSLGYFQHAFAVYGREGEPCRTKDCTGTIRRVVQSGRSTFYCPKCQR
ncbi:MAG: bifunctional DNA-formamidopyrimidine glycosylase/DNA-(apurinic or apyrimidinic site) lyase [Pseudomonadota bacterium]